MSVINKYGVSVANELGNKTPQFDPGNIIIIIELIVQILAMFEDCNAGASKATAMVNSPSWLQERLVHLKARRVMGRSEYRKNGHTMVSALLEVGKSVSVDDMSTMMEEWKNG